MENRSRPCALVLVAACLAQLAGCSTTSPLPTFEPITPVDVRVNEAADRLATAIGYRTVSSDPDRARLADQFRQLHQLMRDSFPSVHQTLELETFNDFGLLYTWHGSDPSARPMLLMGHQDVVPVEPETADRWHGDPFSNTVQDGVIWGRGSLDDKLSVLGILEAVEFLLNHGAAPRRTVYLAFGHDEETSGEFGAQAIAHALHERGVRLEFALDEGLSITEGLVPGVQSPVALVGTAEKGYLTLELTATSPGGHSSLPPQHTAIGRLATAIDRLQRNPLKARIRPPASDMFDALAPHLPGVQGFAMNNRWLLGGLVVSQLEASPESNAMIRTTAAPTILRGGLTENVLPSSATVTINFRILPGETIDTVLDHVRNTIDDPDIDIARLPGANDPSPVSRDDSPAFLAIRRTILEVFPGTIVAPALVVAATDARHYEPIADDVYRFLPVSLDSERIGSIHGVNEYIDVEDYADVIRFYIRLLENTAITPPHSDVAGTTTKRNQTK